VGNHRVWKVAIVAVTAALAACGPKKSEPPAAAGSPTAQVAPAPTTATADPAHDHAGCAAPAWAPQRVVGFALDSCESRAWATLDLSAPAAGGAKTLAGARDSVTFALVDQTRNPTSAAARAAIVGQALKTGAQLVSDAHDGYGAVLRRVTPQGEVWMVFTHGSGNESSTLSYTLTTLRVAPLAQEAQARPMTGPLAPQPATCADAPWVARSLAAFKVSGCEGRTWDRVTISLPGGDKTLGGARLTVVHDLTDDKLSPVAMAVTRNWSNALQAIGAKLVSNPSDEDRAVLTQTTPAGEFWYESEHGSGNSDYTASYSLTTIQVIPFPQQVTVRPLTGPLAPAGKTCADPPWVTRQLTDYSASACNYRDFDQVKVTLPDGDHVLAGHVLTVDYSLPDPKHVQAPLFMETNYDNALQGIGARRVSDPKDIERTVLTQKTAQGEVWFVVAQTSGNDESTGSFEVTTVQIGGPPPKACALEVYGINFDFDKSDLRPDSEPVLAQLAALFASDPGYVAEVGGHTDNVGQSGYNLKLSAARAEAVRAWLVAHGVANGRLTARGYGDTRPLVPNTSDAGRAKNRRVELKRANCKG